MDPAPYPEFDGTAACTQVDPETFFPPKGNAVAVIEAGRRVCKGDNSHGTCPFLSGCLNYALTHNVEGMWGGKSDEERRAIRKKYRIKAVSLELASFVGGPRGPDPRNLIPHGTAVGVERHRRKYAPLCDECQAYDDRRKPAKSAS